MDKEQFEKILLFYFMLFIMDEEKEKKANHLGSRLFNNVIRKSKLIYLLPRKLSESSYILILPVKFLFSNCKQIFSPILIL